MAMIEIDESQLRTLNTAYGLLDKLMANPKTKAQAEKLIKTLHPDVVTSEDLAAPIVGPIAERLEKLEKRLQAEDDGKVESKYAADFKRLKDEGFTEDGIEKIKKLMVDRNNADVDSAAALFEKQNPKPSEKPGIRSNNWNIGAKDDKATVDDLMKDPDTWARDEAAKVLNEIKQNGQPSFGAVVGS